MTPLERVHNARTFLFVPGDRPERFDKAIAAGADLVIIDLEDAVALENKEIARQASKAWLEAGGEALVRINSMPDEAALDVTACAGVVGLVGVVVPKAESAAQLASVRERVASPIVALIESAIGIAHVRHLASAADRLAIGSFDLSFDLDMAEDSRGLEVAGFEIVLASRLAGLPAPVATVTASIGDGSDAADAAQRSRANGFGGKLCIHPVQVAPVLAALRPAPLEVAWARRVVAAAGDGAAGTVDGAMIDRPVIERARRILAQSD